MAHNGAGVDGTKLFAYAAKTQLMRVVDHWWCAVSDKTRISSK